MCRFRSVFLFSLLTPLPYCSFYLSVQVSRGRRRVEVSPAGQGADASGEKHAASQFQGCGGVQYKAGYHHTGAVLSVSALALLQYYQ